MPSSPRTPRHSRHTSAADSTFASPYDNERRLSKGSMHSHSSSNRHSFGRSDSIDHGVFGGSGGEAPSNGLGNLADELAGWDEDDEDEELDLNFQELTVEGGDTRDSGVDVEIAPAKSAHLTPPLNGHGRAHSDYDGSDYGGDSDLDSPGMPPGLIARMDTVESLARRGTEDNGTERDNVVKRVVEALRDLGSQSGVESGASRLITAHSALSTHLLHQTRLLQSLTYPLFSPLTIPPDEEIIDEILPMLVSLNESMPRPTTTAFQTLTQLHGSTVDLVQTLNYLSDSLHMSRQTTTTATRRLKSVKELVAEMKKEEEQREEGERWLERGNWSERLKNREGAAVCGEVVEGFEEVCNSWRARLVARAEAVEVGA